jgi:hypothetical protein
VPRSSAKKKKGAAPTTAPPKDAPLNPPLNPLRAGMPAMDSIIGVKEIRKGKKLYRIIETNEVDEYERTPPKGKRRPKK